jgi:hypothetical protein
MQAIIVMNPRVRALYPLNHWVEAEQLPTTSRVGLLAAMAKPDELPECPQWVMGWTPPDGIAVPKWRC